MKCSICKHGNTSAGHANVMLERGASFIVVKNVPADVCDTCGEYYLSDNVAAEVLRIAEEVVARGAEVEVIQFAA